MLKGHKESGPIPGQVGKVYSFRGNILLRYIYILWWHLKRIYKKPKLVLRKR